MATSLNKKTTNNGQKSGAKTAKAKTINKPHILEQAEATVDIRALLRMFNITGVESDKPWHQGAFEYTIEPTADGQTYPLVCRNARGTGLSGQMYNGNAYRRIPVLSRNKTGSAGIGESLYSIPVAYVDKDLAVWTSTLEVFVVGNLNGNWSTSLQRTVPDADLCFKRLCICNPFKKTDKFVFGLTPLQSDTEINELIRARNPYAYDFVANNCVDPLNYAMIPYMETLAKAGYLFIDRFYQNGRHISQSDVDCLNRLCKNGSNPAAIFKTSKAVYKVLGPAERDMQLWDTYRKLDKFGRITKETIQQSYDRAMSVKNLDLINQILAQKHAGKQIFDWETLFNYLNRLDKYEAISNDEALLLLKDYLNMCRMLGMKPRTDGDSLKREHDVAARLCRNMRNEKLAAEMLPACKELEKYNYNEGVYFVRAIENFEDLLSEATQQHSCLVSYGQDIAKRKSKIFVLREVARPDRSLITIELSSDRRSIRQALTAYNKPIRNKSQHEFLHRWLAYVRDVDRCSA